MMPTGPRILDLVAAGVLVLDPAPDPADVNPNSVNLRLGRRLRVYQAQLEYLRWWAARSDPAGTTVAAVWGGDVVPEDCVLDPHRDNRTVDLEIPAGGLVLVPGVLYLGHTVERAGSTGGYAPVLEGRSTLARVGLQSHQTAGFGDVGFRRQWTLEITVVSPVRVRRNDPVCQIAFHATEGPEQLYAGRYADQAGPTAAAPLRGRA